MTGISIAAKREVLLRNMANKRSTVSSWCSKVMLLILLGSLGWSLQRDRLGDNIYHIPLVISAAIIIVANIALFFVIVYKTVYLTYPYSLHINKWISFKENELTICWANAFTNKIHFTDVAYKDIDVVTYGENACCIHCGSKNIYCLLDFHNSAEICNKFAEIVTKK